MRGGRLREMVAHGRSTVCTSQKEKYFQLTDFQFFYDRCKTSPTLDTDGVM